MVTYESMNMLLQFGMFLATALTAIVAVIIAIVNTKKSNRPLP